MSSSSKLLCAVYAPLAMGAQMSTWSQNLAFFAESPVVGASLMP